ncbi:unnamed protein product [Rhizophagus irregularis]|nr:unnamed protein product [Rhizophagus irregularis]
MLEPTKESWASCYINKIFNCGINSTQRIESLNCLLKDTVQKNFFLCQLESEIQNILDNEIKYEQITKMHNSLPRQTLDDVPSKFFGHINCRFADQSVQPYKTILGRSSYDILTLSWLRDPSITLCSADSLPSCFSCITISFADIRSVLFTFPARKKPSNFQ